MDKGAIHSYNERTLTQIMGAKDPIAFYVTGTGFSFATDDDPHRVNIEGLIIHDGDIDDMYNFSTIVYSSDGVSRWDGVNAHGDEYYAFIERFVKENKFIQSFKKHLDKNG